MFLVLDAMFRRHGSSIIVPADTAERTAVRQARDYLIENFASDVGLEELATVAGLSRAHLIRAFRKEFHITPHSFLTDIRIRGAAALEGGRPAGRDRARMRFCRPGAFHPPLQGPHRADAGAVPGALITFVQDGYLLDL